jgi:hypothetical protein
MFTIQGTIHCDTDHSATLTPADVPLDGVTVRVSEGATSLAEATTPDAATPGHYLANVTYAGTGPINATVEVVAGTPQGATFVYPAGGQTAVNASDGGSATVDFLLSCTAALDSFSCYKVSDSKNPPFGERSGVAVNDQFATHTLDVKKPYLLCAPADVDGSGITDPATHMCCYKVKAPKLSAPITAQTIDQYGALQLNVKKFSLLCQPCSNTASP